MAVRDMVISDLLNLQLLKEAIEIPFLGTLWTHGDSGMLTPYVCECSFGDGLRLLKIATINQRPNYHVVRVHSGWETDGLGEHIDDILTAIELECGSARCGYSDGNLCTPRKERIRWCQCEECDGEHLSVWPEIDGDGGCSWGWYDWNKVMRGIALSK